MIAVLSSLILAVSIPESGTLRDGVKEQVHFFKTPNIIAFEELFVILVIDRCNNVCRYGHSTISECSVFFNLG